MKEVDPKVVEIITVGELPQLLPSLLDVSATKENVFDVLHPVFTPWTPAIADSPFEGISIGEETVVEKPQKEKANLGEGLALPQRFPHLAPLHICFLLVPFPVYFGVVPVQVSAEANYPDSVREIPASNFPRASLLPSPTPIQGNVCQSFNHHKCLM